MNPPEAINPPALLTRDHRKLLLAKPAQTPPVFPLPDVRSPGSSDVPSHVNMLALKCLTQGSCSRSEDIEVGWIAPCPLPGKASSRHLQGSCFLGFFRRTRHEIRCDPRSVVKRHIPEVPETFCARLHVERPWAFAASMGATTGRGNVRLVWFEVSGYTTSNTPPNNHTVTQPHNHKFTQSLNHTVTQPHNHTTIQPYYHTTTQPHSHTATQPYSHTTIQPHNHTAIQPYSHAAIKPYNHTNHTTIQPYKSYNDINIRRHDMNTRRYGGMN